MDRRRFLALLSAGVAGAVLDPERALWVPGAKRIFLPAVQSVWIDATTLEVWNQGLLKAGDIFTIDGVYVPNPSDRVRLTLQEYVMVTQVQSPTTFLVERHVEPSAASRGVRVHFG